MLVISVVERHGRSQGKKRAFSPLEIGTKNQKFLENLKLAAKFRLIHIIVAITVYLPVRHDTSLGRN